MILPLTLKRATSILSVLGESTIHEREGAMNEFTKLVAEGRMEEAEAMRHEADTNNELFRRGGLR